MFYTYVLQSKKDSALYFGYTNDLQNRLKEHNNGINPSTKISRPWVVIYYEACLIETDAKRREHFFKTTQGKRLLKRRLKDYFYALKG
ncbi:MAG TPA: GIY-YIG nuclease family protein [Candidatus Paceibacterota bacterium]|nr:GIY-YIG nuclease family protein [Candidatus Pacearchaeota archaeon]HRZ51443.1 GIY-YIG nuclease family protein [Candidatus Paceibacterota bacterium]HSA37156.1 GIY-YIG nuclease family protein [Candidatus Paceibacterota bacterium]